MNKKKVHIDRNFIDLGLEKLGWKKRLRPIQPFEEGHPEFDEALVRVRRAATRMQPENDVAHPEYHYFVDFAPNENKIVSIPKNQWITTDGVFYHLDDLPLFCDWVVLNNDSQLGVGRLTYIPSELYVDFSGWDKNFLYHNALGKLRNRLTRKAYRHGNNK